MSDFSGKGWLAEIVLRYEVKRGVTRLTEKRHIGPLMVQRPFYPEQGIAHTYLLHPPGGVVGGDKLFINIDVQSEAHALLTTPGATKFYRSAHQIQTLKVASNGFLEWLPQENIFFPEAQVRLETHIHIASNAKFIGWEIQCFGRPVLNEWFENGNIKGRFNFYIDENLILTESLFVDGLQKKAAAMREFPMLGSLYIYPATEELKNLIQQRVECFSCSHDGVIEYGLTDVDGIVVLRLLGSQTEPMMACFVQVWQTVREHWLGYCPEPPRIWAT
ncbi:urease accessory protein UreD [Proteus sp. FME41]|uniref:urease accessory protein UreD n=1 Tax=Proteus sp. FME41 TaxID=2742608 RepID=UPI001866EC89|nr:urease accessory protein UreD [Proteus sp. FME41]